VPGGVYPSTFLGRSNASCSTRPRRHSRHLRSRGYDAHHIGHVAKYDRELRKLATDPPRRCPKQLLIYAWLPLGAWEFAGNAHIDCAAAGLLALVLLVSVRRRAVWTGVILAAATLGDATQQTLREIWNGSAYQDFRAALLSDTPPRPCTGCGLRWSL
jgi:MYXO-CTERM domain-containing protein